MTTPGETAIQGVLNSTPGKSFVLRFFANPAGGTEGKTFVGATRVTTDASGLAAFVFKPAQAIPAGQTVTATATGAGGGTSEFSDEVAVV